MKLFETYDGPSIHAGKLILLGVQHTFTMFGATVLVPMLTGSSISVALFMAGLCTLMFHLITRGKMPVFLGSSFAFIAPTVLVSQQFGAAYAAGGIVVAGLAYCVIAAIVRFVGAKTVISFFPPIVTGPIIMIIGLMLAPTAISSAGENWLLAAVSFITVAVVSLYTKGFIRVLPVICGLAAGYAVAVITGSVDFTAVAEAGWIGLPEFTMAQFDPRAIIIIVPVAIATMVEHMGDVIAVSAICGKDFIKSPGLHRTLLADGLGTSLSAMFGGPANTTYSENTGVLALTKVFNPRVMRIAACFAIVLSVVPKLSAIISTIPNGVIGGISIVLFGMISATGARMLVENSVDFKSPRNMLIAAVVLVLGLGGAKIGAGGFELSGVGLAAISGIILNKALPDRDYNKSEER